MPEIISVEEDSIAKKIGLKKGDKLLKINGIAVRDYIDYQYQTAEDIFVLEVEKKNKEIKEYEIEADYHEKLGLEFDSIIFDQLKLCKNKCLFCFVDQFPAGYRKSLQLKDDDYRFSFLQGSFITLTNLDAQELQRIKKLRLSPLNISVHTTNPELRQQMMKNKKAGEIKKQLKYLAEAGIKFNTQVVLCPTINDGKELQRTIQDLENLYPAVISLGIVPVGLTKYNKSSKLTSFTKKQADKLIKQIIPVQEDFKKKYQQNWLYLADEFYLLAGREIPEYGHYHNFPQLQNGIGLSRTLLHDFAFLKNNLPEKIAYKKAAIVTAKLGALALEEIVKQLNVIEGLDLELIVVENKFLGDSVTVTGLLSGEDILNELKKEKEIKNIFIPAIALNKQGLFIDNFTLEELQDNLPGKSLYPAADIVDIVEVVKSWKNQ